MDAGSKVHGTAGVPRELVGQTLTPAYQGSSVGPFAVVVRQEEEDDFPVDNHQQRHNGQNLAKFLHSHFSLNAYKIPLRHKTEPYKSSIP